MSDASSTKTPGVQARWYEGHSLAGVLALIPLFVISVTGTITLFSDELRAWHLPELRRPAHEVASLDAALSDYLPQVPRDTNRLNLSYPSEGMPVLRADWRLTPGGDRIHTVIDPATGANLGPPSSELSHLLYEWHFLRPLPQGLLFAGFISLFWLALTFSGVYLHRKKLLAQFRGRGWAKRKGRAMQSALHTLAATLTLPFHLLYGVTGAFFGLLLIVTPVALLVVFGGDRDAMKALVEARNPPEQELAETQVDALPPLDPFVADAMARYPGTRPSFVSLVEPYDEAARLNIFFLDSEDQRGNLSYDLHRSMEPVHDVAPGQKDALFAVLRPVLNLHFAHYGGYPVRFLYFALGLLLCVLTYAGARMWVLRHRKTSPRAATACERLFDGFGVGLLPAIGVYLWANRLLPLGLESRLEIESGVFHAAWVLIAFGVLWRGTGVATRRALVATSLGLLAAVPLLDGLVHDLWPWSAEAWHVPSVGVINGTIVCVVLFAAARSIRRHTARKLARMQAQRAAQDTSSPAAAE